MKFLFLLLFNNLLFSQALTVNGKLFHEEPNYTWYFYTFYSDTSENLYLSTSKDGLLNWSNPTKILDTLDSLRDPSPIQYKDKFYIVYTRNGFGLNNVNFGLLESNDLINWSFVDSIGFKDKYPNVNHVWAPEWFLDDNGKLYVVVSVSLGTVFQTYLIESLDVESDKWGSITKLNILNRTNIIDTYLIKKDGIYYAYIKNNVTDNIDRAQSDSLFGNYIVTDSLDWAGWAKDGYSIEGQSIIKHKNFYIAYLDYYVTANMNDSVLAHQVYYSKSIDMDYWTEPQKLSSVITHGTPIKIYK